MTRLAAIFVALGGWAFALAATAQVPGPAHARTSLVAQTTSVTPGSTVYVAVIQDLDAGWHTYWRNPGDAGEAPTLAWTLPAGWRAGSIVWPAPRRLPLGPIMNYGYEGHVVMPVALQVPADARVGDTAHLAASLDYLICAQVCVPATAKITLDLPVKAGKPVPDPVGGPAISKALAASPAPSGLHATLQEQGVHPGKTFNLAIAGPALSGATGADAYFYPVDGELIDQAKPQAVERGPRGLTLTLIAGPDFAKSPGPTAVQGVLETDGRAYDVDAAPGPPVPGAAGLGAPAGAKDQNATGLALAVVFAFLGGLILNLMPCVFPILSIKAAALARHAGEASHARSQALAFLAGVLVSFLALAGALIAARAAGAAVGWGFQLQSPVIVAGLALIMLAAALNLSGLFEIGASLQGVGTGLAARDGLVGSAFTGVLAVVVAAPCTAPFMGPALGYALTQSWPASLAVFLGLGLGFAAPFTVIAFSPAIMRALPRPGAWMETFRRALAFPMYAAAAWLAWVLAQQSGQAGLAKLFAAAVILALCAWVFGLYQDRRANGRPSRGLAAIAAVALIAAFGVAFATPFASAGASSSPTEVAGDLPSQPWSPQAVADLRAQGRPVLVNFTAAWCVTCQVNERVVFSDPAVARAFRKARVAYLVADWTNRDGAIAKALQAQGRIGVPLYLLYDAKGDAPKVLPQLLTPGLVSHAVEAAAAPGAPSTRTLALAPRLATGPVAG